MMEGRALNMAAGRPSLHDAAMEITPIDGPDVRLAVPFCGVRDIEASLRFYVEGLGFTMVRQWAPEDRIRWCWIELGSAAVMLQDYRKDGRPGGWPAGPIVRVFPSASSAATPSPCTSRPKREGSSRRGRSSATTCG
jgi:catechol 2,3-dioxygenase-like lactoylglutathione lyase family enzyme